MFPLLLQPSSKARHSSLVLTLEQVGTASIVFEKREKTFQRKIQNYGDQDVSGLVGFSGTVFINREYGPDDTFSITIASKFEENRGHVVLCLDAVFAPPSMLKREGQPSVFPWLGRKGVKAVNDHKYRSCNQNKAIPDCDRYPFTGTVNVALFTLGQRACETANPSLIPTMSFSLRQKDGRNGWSEMENLDLVLDDHAPQVFVRHKVPWTILLAASFSPVLDGCSIGFKDFTKQVLGNDRGSSFAADRIHGPDEGGQTAIRPMIHQARGRIGKGDRCGSASSHVSTSSISQVYKGLKLQKLSLIHCSTFLLSLFKLLRKDHCDSSSHLRHLRFPRGHHHVSQNFSCS